MRRIAIELKWALIFTLVGLLWMVLEKWSGLHGKHIDYHLYLTNLFAIPAIWMMVAALKEKKNVFYSEQMSYMQGFRSGLLLTVFIAILSPLAQWVTTYVITPEYFPNVIKRSVELGYFQSTEEAQAQFNFENYARQGLIGALVMGIVTTAVAMVFIRTRTTLRKG